MGFRNLEEPPNVLAERALRKRRQVYKRKLRCQKRQEFRKGNSVEELFSDKSLDWRNRISRWIDRELTVLLPDGESSLTVKLYIQSLIQRNGFKSLETIRNLKPFLYENTKRFLDELEAFCHSTLSMEDYDKYVQYKQGI